MVDRAVVADEVGVCGAQPDLQRLPRLASGLGAHDVAHGIAHRHQATDDLRRFQAEPFPGLAGLDLYRDRLTGDDLAEASALPGEVAALLDGGTVGGTADLDGIGELLGVVGQKGVSVVDEDVGRQVREGGVDLDLQRASLQVGAAGVGPARSINPTPLTVGAQHHLGVRQEILVHLDHAVTDMPRRGQGVRVGGGLFVHPFEARFILGIGRLLV